MVRRSSLAKWTRLRQHVSISILVMYFLVLFLPILSGGMAVINPSVAWAAESSGTSDGASGESSSDSGDSDDDDDDDDDPPPPPPPPELNGEANSEDFKTPEAGIPSENGKDDKADDKPPVDTDGDGMPDPLDNDDDGDGIPDSADPAPKDPNVDTDKDGIPDNEDPDDDNDGTPDVLDDTPKDINNDTDGDGLLDFEDLDDDNDGIVDEFDEDRVHPDIDIDKDGIPNFMDNDVDGDGVYDDLDVDIDNNGVPDSIQKMRDGGEPGQTTKDLILSNSLWNHGTYFGIFDGLMDNQLLMDPRYRGFSIPLHNGFNKWFGGQKIDIEYEKHTNRAKNVFVKVKGEQTEVAKLGLNKGKIKLKGKEIDKIKELKVLKSPKWLKALPLVDMGIGVGKVWYGHAKQGDFWSTDNVVDTVNEVVKWGAGYAVGFALGSIIGAGVPLIVAGTVVATLTGWAYDRFVAKRLRDFVKGQIQQLEGKYSS